ncbi:MAG: DUF4198 domain-containing protein [Litorivicinus sp.]
MSLARFQISTFVLLLVWAFNLQAHEFWIEPADYRLIQGDDMVADIKVGQSFSGASVPFLTHTVARSEGWHQGQRYDIPSTYGALPALRIPLTGDGLHVIVHETEENTLRYRDDPQFTAFGVEKGYPDLVSQHRSRYPDGRILERYFRYAKSLITQGSSTGEDIRVGMPIELVLDSNPYQTQQIRGLLWGPDGVLANHRVTAFTKAAGGTLGDAQHTTTDAQGRFSFPWPPGHDVLLDAVMIRALPDQGETKPRWESLWASTTFSAK